MKFSIITASVEITLRVNQILITHSRAGVPKVVDIDPQGSMGPSKGSMISKGVERGSMNNQGVIECLLGVEGAIHASNIIFL